MRCSSLVLFFSSPPLSTSSGCLIDCSAKDAHGDACEDARKGDCEMLADYLLDALEDAFAVVLVDALVNADALVDVGVGVGVRRKVR